MFTLYEYPPSGNSYKVHLALHQLGLDHKSVHIDILKGESRTPEFLSAINPNGKVPVLETPDGKFLPESVAILTYLADGSPLYPNDRWTRARIHQWLAFEQHNLEVTVAEARFWLHSLKKTPEELGDKLVDKQKGGIAALGVLEKRLEGRDLLVGGAYSIADIGLYGYTHVAADGGFDLGPFPNIRAWCDRVAGQPDYIPLGS